MATPVHLKNQNGTFGFIQQECHVSYANWRKNLPISNGCPTHQMFQLLSLRSHHDGIVIQKIQGEVQIQGEGIEKIQGEVQI